MKSKIAILIVMALIVGLISFGCSPGAGPSDGSTPAPAAEPEFKWAHQFSGTATQPKYVMLEECFDRIKVASNGRFEITLYPESEIVPRAETSVGVRDGAIQMAHVMGHDDIGRIGPSGYLMLTSGFPGAANSLDMLAWCYLGDGLDAMSEVYEDYGIFIGAAYGGAEIFCYSNKPLTTADDFKGLKFRTAGMWGEILESYGASVVNLPGGELYQAMERGVIDAFELGPPSYNWAQGFQEICEYLGVPGIHSPGSGDTILVNKKSWAELPSDLQGILYDEIMTLAFKSYQEQQIEDAIAMNNYRNYGTKIFTVSDEFQQDIVKRSKEYVDRYCAEDAMFKMLYENQKAFYTQWRGLTNELESDYTVYD